MLNIANKSDKLLCTTSQTTTQYWTHHAKQNILIVKFCNLQQTLKCNYRCCLLIRM